MALRRRQTKHLLKGALVPRLLTLAGHKRKRLHKGGVGPEMRSPVGFPGEISHAARTGVNARLTHQGPCR